MKKDEIEETLIGVFLEYNPCLARLLREAVRRGAPPAEVEEVVRSAAGRQQDPDGRLTVSMALLYHEWLEKEMKPREE